MKRIVECLLEAGILEEDIHRILDLIEEEYEVISEDIESQITKKYGGDLFDDGTRPRGRYLHREAINNKTNEVIAAARRNLPDNEKGSTFSLDRESNKIEARRANTKNKIGAYKTDLHTIGYGGKLRSPVEMDDNRKEDAKNGYPKAIAKSIKRNKKNK